MSVTRLGELYVNAAMLKDGYSTGDPVGVACAPEAFAAFVPHLEACPHDDLVRRIRTRRGVLLREVARQASSVKRREPVRVAAEAAAINNA